DRLARYLVVTASVLARMQRVAGAIERADADAVRGETRPEVAPLGVAVEHPIELQMRRRGPVAAAEFEHVELEPRRGCEQRFEVGVRQTVGDHADLHRRRLAAMPRRKSSEKRIC